MLIDIHTHASNCSGFNRYGDTRYPTFSELLQKMDQEGIDRAVVLSTVSPECRYVVVTPFEVLDQVRQHPDRLIPFAGVDPRMMRNSTDADFRPMLRFFKESGIKGIGEYIPNLELDHPLNLNFFAQLEEIGGMPLLFHLANTRNFGGQYGCYDDLGLPRLERVLKAFPKLTFLGHSQVFWAEISSTVAEENRSSYPKGEVSAGRVVELMRRYPNLHGDLSAGSGYNAISRDIPFGLSFLEEFQDRLYFGTDIALLNQVLPQIPFFHKLKTEKLISTQAYEKITWKNSTALLKL